MTTMPEVYLHHILLNIRHIERFTQSGLETFLKSSLIQLAVRKARENIGEMVKRLPHELLATEPGKVVRYCRITRYHCASIPGYRPGGCVERSQKRFTTA